MFKHILIPTDGSARSSKALKRGLALAKKLSAKVTVVHVFYPFVLGFYGEFGMGYQTMEQQMREFGRTQGRKYLDRAQAAAHAAGVKISRLLVESAPPWKGIVEIARRRRCDAILMGAHGYGAVSGLILGSQTTGVLAHSKVPVIVIR